VGVLAYMFVPAVLATVLLTSGLAICTIVTLSPLSRRKALEVVAQSAESPESVGADVARFDGLDAASVVEPELPHSTPKE